jgi:hypothetical protein
LGFDGFSSGWEIGSNDWRRVLAKEQADAISLSGLAAKEAAALREARWRGALDKALSERGRTQAEALAARKSEVWKLRLALEVRAGCRASVSWLSRELNLGSTGSARSRLSELRLARK